jgi:hypothetical protein
MHRACFSLKAHKSKSKKKVWRWMHQKLFLVGMLFC